MDASFAAAVKETLAFCVGRETDNCPNSILSLGRRVRYLVPGEAFPKDWCFNQYGRPCEILPEVVFPLVFSDAPLGKISIRRERENMTTTGLALLLPQGCSWEGVHEELTGMGTLVDSRISTSNTQIGGSFEANGQVSVWSRFVHEISQFSSSSRTSLGSGKAIVNSKMKQKLGVVWIDGAVSSPFPYAQGIGYGVQDESNSVVMSGRHNHSLATQGQESFTGQGNSPNGGALTARGTMTDMTTDTQGPYAVARDGDCHSVSLLAQSAADLDQHLQSNCRARLLLPYKWDRMYLVVADGSPSSPGNPPQPSLPQSQDIGALIATPRRLVNQIHERVEHTPSTASDRGSSPVSAASDSSMEQFFTPRSS